MKDHSWLFYLSHKKSPKLPLEDSRTKSSSTEDSAQYKPHLLIFSSSLEKGKQQSWPMALVPSLLPGALPLGTPNGKCSLHRVCEHTLPVPPEEQCTERACRASAQPGGRGELAAVSTKAPPPRPPAQRAAPLLQDPHSRREVAWCLPKPHRAASSALRHVPPVPRGPLEGSVRKGRRNRPPRVLPQTNTVTHRESQGKTFSVCRLKRKSFLFPPGDLSLFVLWIGNLTLQNTDNTTCMKYHRETGRKGSVDC